MNPNQYPSIAPQIRQAIETLAQLAQDQCQANGQSLSLVEDTVIGAYQQDYPLLQLITAQSQVVQQHGHGVLSLPCYLIIGPRHMHDSPAASALTQNNQQRIAAHDLFWQIDQAWRNYPLTVITTTTPEPITQPEGKASQGQNLVPNNNLIGLSFQVIISIPPQ